MEKATAYKLESCLFTTSKRNEEYHYSVIAINEKYAVSFQHGPHSSYKINDNVVLYSVIDPGLEYEAVVVASSGAHDVIAFELVKGHFVHYPHALDDTFRGQNYKQLGVSEDRTPIWKDGIISQEFFGFCVGTSHGNFGDSGSGVFDSFGRFLGISVAKKDFAFRDIRNMRIEDVAEHHPTTKIISSKTISGILGVVGPDPFVPQEKRVK